MVIDLRENGGGNGALNRYPVQQIIRRPWLDRPDKLYVIIGRMTFSAAQQFTNLLEAWTQCALVGEPTGQRPSQYGDHRPLHLKALGVTVQIASVFHQAPNEFDARSFVPPRIYTPLDSRSYAQGIDPAMTAILHPDTTAPVGEVIQRTLAAGDTAAAERALRAARDRVANRFRTFEADVNRLGYQLLADGRGEQALAAFRLNTRAYPGSANAWDSLGETLLGAGHREDAIAAYRQAVRNDPAFTPSLEALRRLGVQP
jgi:tetratricopeptide (TPR) repeat protein